MNYFQLAHLKLKYGIKNARIKNGLVNVNGNVNLKNKNLTQLPFDFGVVTGNFDCSHNNLKNLKGAPTSVGGNFNCQFNILNSLHCSPREVGGDFNCQFNNLTTLMGPIKVGKNFNCSNNLLKNIDFSPQEVGGNFICRNNRITLMTSSQDQCDNIRITGDLDCGNDDPKIEYMIGLYKVLIDPPINNANKLFSFEYIPYFMGNFYCDNNVISIIFNLFKNHNSKDYRIIQLINDFDAVRSLEEMINIFYKEDWQPCIFNESNSSATYPIYTLPTKDVIVLDRLNEFLETINKPRVDEFIVNYLRKFYNIV